MRVLHSQELLHANQVPQSLTVLTGVRGVHSSLLPFHHHPGGVKGNAHAYHVHKEGSSWQNYPGKNPNFSSFLHEHYCCHCVLKLGTNKQV